jgi:hypothetical protein
MSGINSLTLGMASEYAEWVSRHSIKPHDNLWKTHLLMVTLQGPSSTFNSFQCFSFGSHAFQ